MRVLIVTASKHAATHEIGRSLADGLLRRGVDAIAVPVDRDPSPDGADAVVVGSAVYAGHWMPAARDWIDRNAGDLAVRPVWLFSSGPLGAPDPRPAEDPLDLARLAQATGAREHRLFAGRLERDLLRLGERALVRAVRAPYGDFRDWVAVDAWAGRITATLTARAPVRAA